MNWRSFATTAAAVVAGIVVVGLVALMFPRLKATVTSAIPTVH